MTDLRQAAQLALEALHLPSMKTQQMLLQKDEAITALREALAQPPHKGLSEHIAQATNGQVHIDPVTGDVGIGTPAAQPEPEQEPVAYYHPQNGFYWAKPTSIFAPTVVDVEPLPLYAAAERNNG